MRPPGRTPAGRRLLRELHGRGGRSRPGAWTRSSPRSTASPPSPTARSSPATWAGRCGRTWTRSTPPTCTPTTSSASGWPRTSNDPSRYLPFLMQGGLDMPDRAYYLDDSARMETIRAQVPGAHREPCSPWPASPDAQAKAARICELERRSRRRTGAARTRVT